MSAVSEVVRNALRRELRHAEDELRRAIRNTEHHLSADVYKERHPREAANLVIAEVKERANYYDAVRAELDRTSGEP